MFDQTWKDFTDIFNDLRPLENASLSRCRYRQHILSLLLQEGERRVVTIRNYALFNCCNNLAFCNSLSFLVRSIIHLLFLFIIFILFYLIFVINFVLVSSTDKWFQGSAILKISLPFILCCSCCSCSCCCCCC